MNKIIKWVIWALMIVGVVLTVMIFTASDVDAAVNGLLYYAYAILILAFVAIFYGIGRDAAVNPKTLVTIGIVVVGAVVLVGIAYLLAPGTPAVGYVGAPVSEGTLKLTDTVLNLTYFAIGAAIIAIIAGIVVDSVKSK